MKAGFTRADHSTTRGWAWYWLVSFSGVVVLAVGLVCFFDRHPLNRAVVYDDPVEEFQYGSIGTDLDNGLPLAIIKLLPRMFPEHLPEGSPKQDYSAFGFVQQPGHDMPIGFSERSRILRFTNINCGVCHHGVVVTPGHPDGQVIPGMPSNTVDLQGFFAFLFAAAADPRFTADNILAEIEKEREPGLLERLAYPLVVPILQGQLLTRQVKLARYFGPHSDHPRWGPGRVDTFDTFKLDLFAQLYGSDPIPEDELYGSVDLPPVWNQRPREDRQMKLHWDGNNDSVRERNFSAALAAGATPDNIDAELDRLDALEAWLMDSLKPPPFPWAIDQALAGRGKLVYEQYCFDCHDFDGSQVGTVVAIEDIGTDRGRLDSYTARFREIQRQYTADRSWAFTRFEKTDGYANMPLDGLWARAPYLHNGSVPTLWHLLLPQDERPAGFYLGDTVYDPERMGFRVDSPTAPDGRPLFWLDTGLRGNGKQGHSGPAYGTRLSDQDKLALIEYLKSF